MTTPRQTLHPDHNPYAGCPEPTCGDLLCDDHHDPTLVPYGCVGLAGGQPDRCGPYAPPHLVTAGLICPDCARPPGDACTASYGWVAPGAWGITRRCANDRAEVPT